MIIKEKFQSDKPLFIPFIMAGHPSSDQTLEALIALAEAGADIIELGVPFSDPVADGPVNQRAAEAALNQGTNLNSIFGLVAKFRSQNHDVPIILFSYLNPILAFGYQKFITQAKEIEVNGVLIVDLPVEEGQEFYQQLTEAGLEIILLASPTTEPKRFELYERQKPSFIYYISRLAVTGTKDELAIDLEDKVKSLKAHLPQMKIAIGFGISNTKQAALVAKFCDGVVIGSLLVQTLQNQGLKAFKQLASELAEAIHNSR